jgi:hypothetical protein
MILLRSGGLAGVVAALMVAGVFLLVVRRAIDQAELLDFTVTGQGGNVKYRTGDSWPPTPGTGKVRRGPRPHWRVHRAERWHRPRAGRLAPSRRARGRYRPRA